MSDKVEYKGKWCLPDSPNDFFEGVLAFTPEKTVTLTVVDFLSDTLLKIEKMKTQYIYGYLYEDGKPVTLFNPFLLTPGRRTLRNDGVSTVSGLEFFVKRAYIGAHFENEDDTCFKEVILEYPNLHEWVNVSGFIRERKSEDVRKGVLTIRYERPDDILLGKVNGFSFLIIFRNTFPGYYSFIGDREIFIKQKLYLRIESREERPYVEFRAAMEWINHLLSIALVKSIKATSITAYSEQVHYMIGDEKVCSDVRVIDGQIIGKEAERELIPYDMLFTYHDIKDNVEEIIEKCKDMSASLVYVLPLYLSVLGGRVIFLEHKFLSLAQSVEGYHRIMMDRTEMSENHHKKRKDEILDAVPSEHKDWLRGKLTYSNEITFRNRLNDIFKDIKLLKNATRINDIVDMRNRLVHLEKGYKLNDEELTKLQDSVEILKIIFNLSIALQIGISIDKIKANTAGALSFLWKTMQRLGLKFQDVDN